MKGFDKDNANNVVIVGEQRCCSRVKVTKFKFSKDLGKFWFTKRVVDEWNEFSSHVISDNPIDTFRKRLDNR